MEPRSKKIASDLKYVADCLGMLDDILSLPNCHDCADSDKCEYLPDWGDHVRFNCPLHVPKKEGDG